MACFDTQMRLRLTALPLFVLALLVVVSLAAHADGGTPTPTASSYAEAVASGMAILVFICGGVWFVIKLMLDPIKERAEKTETKANKVELDLAGVTKDHNAHRETTAKIEETVNDKLDRLAGTVDKLDGKVDALTLAVQSRKKPAAPRN